MEKILQEIRDERGRQDAKWGQQDRPCLDQTLLTREGGCTPERMCEEYEIPSENRAKNMCETAAKNKTITYAHIAVEEIAEVISTFDTHKRREELIQLAAVCVAWLEKIDRDLKQTLTEHWNYKGDELYKLKSIDIPKEDWNNTLITKINLLSTHLNMKSLMGPATIIKVNSKIFKLIKTLTFYRRLNDGTHVLSVYKVKIDNSILEDVILILHEDNPSDVFRLVVDNY